MSGDREAFLRRVSQAVAEGNRAGAAPPLPARGALGWQGAGADPPGRLRTEFEAAGGVFHPAADAAQAVAVVVGLVRQRAARRLFLARGEYLDTLALRGPLEEAGVRVQGPDGLSAAGLREAFFAADVGVTGADWLVAETGTAALSSRPGQPRSASLLPPAHVLVAHQRQVAADLFDLFAALAGGAPPSCLSLITGPSKTGDIELKLVTGVHGPGEVHLVLVQPS